MLATRAKKAFAVLAALMCGVAPRPVSAQVLTWSITGAGCVPTGQTISGVGTFNSAGDVNFPGSSTGEIIVTCPIPSSLRSATHLSVTYRDSDGPGLLVGLRAVLRQKRLDVGGAQDVPGAALNSNAFPVATANVRRSVQFGNACTHHEFVFNHDRFTYYIQVNMIRRRGEILLASVDLTNAVIC